MPPLRSRPEETRVASCDSPLAHDPAPPLGKVTMNSVRAPEVVSERMFCCRVGGPQSVRQTTARSPQRRGIVWPLRLTTSGGRTKAIGDEFPQNAGDHLQIEIGLAPIGVPRLFDDHMKGRLSGAGAEAGEIEGILEVVRVRRRLIEPSRVGDKDGRGFRRQTFDNPRRLLGASRLDFRRRCHSVAKAVQGLRNPPRLPDHNA